MEIVRMPMWGLTMEKAIILEWKVAVGDRVSEGDVLASVETEKIEIDLPSPAAGMVAELLAAVEDEVPVGGEVAVLVTDEDELAAYRNRGR